MNKKRHLNIQGLIKVIRLSLDMHSNNKSCKMKKHILQNLLTQKTSTFSYELPDTVIDYSNYTDMGDLDPNYVTGFIQGDGGLGLILKKNGNISQYFAIGQEKNSLEILEKIKNFFNNVGKIYKINENYYRYTVYKKEDIIKEIIRHLDKYELRGNKYKEYLSIRSYFFKDVSEKEKLFLFELNFKGKRRRKRDSLIIHENE